MATALERLKNAIYRTKNAMASGTLTDKHIAILKSSLSALVNSQKDDDDLIDAASAVLVSLRDRQRSKFGDIELEMWVLGAMCVSPDAARYSFDILSRSSFFTPQMQDFYTGLCEAESANVPLEEISAVHHFFWENGWLEKIGGAATIAEAVMKVATVYHIEWYAKKLQELEIRRGARLVSEYLLEKSEYGTIKEYNDAMTRGMSWLREAFECYRRHRRIPINPISVTEDEKRC